MFRMKKIMAVTVLISVSAVYAAGTPDVLKTIAGQTVTTVEAWEQVRRPEVLELFKTHVFGRNAVERPATLRFEPIEPDR